MEKPQYGHQVFFDEVRILDQRKTDKTEIKYVETKSFGNILFMDGEVQLSTMDEHRYHETLVHPLMCRTGVNVDLNILVIGGGDGCAVREILKWQEAIASVTVIDYDNEFVHEYGMNRLAKVNDNAFKNPMVSYICDDAVNYLKQEKFKFDIIFIDLPDPDGPEMIALYTEVIRLAKTRFKIGISMHVGPATIDPESPQRQIITHHFKKLLKEDLIIYHVKMGTCYVPSFSNDWAFLYVLPNLEKIRDSSDEVYSKCKYWEENGNNDFVVPRDLMLA
jgi:predicted membrane-bound spermidine synthase